jgi:hypothetical protein
MYDNFSNEELKNKLRLKREILEHNGGRGLNLAEEIDQIEKILYKREYPKYGVQHEMDDEPTYVVANTEEEDTELVDDNKPITGIEMGTDIPAPIRIKLAKLIANILNSDEPEKNIDTFINIQERFTELPPKS